jgi:hypothetical protein
MGRFLFPLFLIALGVFGLIEHDVVNDEWSAMYPEDAARKEALAHCTQEDGMFNRFSASGRTACYQKYLQVDLPAAAPGMNVGVPGTAPSHVVPHTPPVRVQHN